VSEDEVNSWLDIGLRLNLIVVSQGERIDSERNTILVHVIRIVRHGDVLSGVEVSGVDAETSGAELSGRVSSEESARNVCEHLFVVVDDDF
jgi:hypothetical protein